MDWILNQDLEPHEVRKAIQKYLKEAEKING
jgi:hypothetical protein